MLFNFKIRRARVVDLGAEAIFLYWYVYSPFTTTRFNTWQEAMDYIIECLKPND